MRFGVCGSLQDAPVLQQPLGHGVIMLGLVNHGLPFGMPFGFPHIACSSAFLSVDAPSHTVAQLYTIK